MASNNGYLTHCRICGTPIFSLGNRQFCSACYAQNRRNAITGNLIRAAAGYSLADSASTSLF